ISGGHDQTVRLWEAATGRCVRFLKGHPDWVMALAFSPDGLGFISACQYEIKMWETATGRCIRSFGNAEFGEVRARSPVSAVAFGPDNQHIVVGDCDGRLTVRKATSGLWLRTLQTGSGSVRAIAFSADSRWLACAGGDKVLSILDMRSGLCVRTLR